MDRIKAEELERTLKGASVGGWSITALIDHGKSAAVFRAERGTELAAVKIFDSALIEKYGGDTQIKRIERELDLIGEHHEHLVKILGGGQDTATKLFYIVMEYLEFPNLERSLGEIPNEKIHELIFQLSSAARFLEGKRLCHRDIKPSNIVLTDNFSKLKLLDFGVIRPIGASSLTDPEEIKAFVGTLQYSSPEFLLRNEEDTIEGWRAVTFYQIGGVLHDLIMRRPLFDEFKEPFARLVNAVQYEIPQINGDVTNAPLVNLAGRCLLKDPQLRLKYVSWSDFDPSASVAPGAAARRRVTNRIALARAQSPPKHAQETQVVLVSNLRNGALDFLKEAIRSIRVATNSVPLGSVHLVHLGDDEEVLCISFDKSESHLISEKVHVFIRVTVEDVAARAVRIFGSACSCKDEPVPEFDRPSTRAIFEGIYDADLVFPAFEEYVFSIMDLAQAIKAPTTDACVWLGSQMG